MKKLTILTVAASLVCGGLLSAQAEEATPAPWVSSAFAGLTLTRGNSDTMLATGNIKTSKKEKQNEWAFGIAGVYGENDSVKKTEAIAGFGQYNRLFNERLYGYLRLDGLYDGIAEVDYRFAINPGLGYYLIKQTNTLLAVEAGPGAIIERRSRVNNSYPSLRLGERFEHKFSPNARMWQTAEILPEVTEFSNYVANFEIGVAASLSKSLELSVILQDTYVSQTVSPIKKNDLKLVTGLTYKF